MIKLTVSDPRPGQISERILLVDGDTELARQIGTAAQTTPDQTLTIPGARIHVVADPTTLTISAGRITAVQSGVEL